jgi:hypothetical protein
VADQVIFHNRESWWENSPSPSDAEDLQQLPPRAFEDAKKSAPGYDVYALEQEWREWWSTSGKPKLDNPGAAFVGFCASRNRKAPLRTQKIKPGL